MVLLKKNNQTQPTEGKIVNRSITISTLNVSITVSSESSQDTLKDLEKLATRLMDKYIKEVK